MASIGFPLSKPTPTYEDNQATIKQVLKDRITPEARPLDVLITGLHEHKLRGTFSIHDCRSDLQLAYFNSKPLGGDLLANKVYWAVGARYLPPKNSIHHQALQLNQFPVAEQYTKPPTRKIIPTTPK